MKLITTAFLAAVLFSAALFADSVDIAAKPVRWLRNASSPAPEENAQLHDDSKDVKIARRFQISPDGNRIVFEMDYPYNCMKWMETKWEGDGEHFVPDTGSCHVALFAYNEQSGSWIGGIVGSVATPLVENADISGLYSGTVKNWPKLKSKLNNNIKLRFCLCKFIRGKWRRSNWSYNFNIE